MFPDYPRSVIEKELIATKSKEATINNILDGNVQVTSLFTLYFHNILTHFILYPDSTSRTS